MGILKVLGLVLGGSIGSKVVAEEIKAWCPSIAEFIARSAARRLPPDQQERYMEEWTSDINQVPGFVSKVLFALDLYRAMFGINISIRRELRQGASKVQNKATELKIKFGEPRGASHQSVSNNGKVNYSASNILLQMQELSIRLSSPEGKTLELSDYDYDRIKGEMRSRLNLG